MSLVVGGMVRHLLEDLLAVEPDRSRVVHRNGVVRGAGTGLNGHEARVDAARLGAGRAEGRLSNSVVLRDAMNEDKEVSATNRVHMTTG